MSYQSLPSLIWSVADLLRGDYKQSDYGLVILPFTILRRLDCAHSPRKPVPYGHDSAKPKTLSVSGSKQTCVNTSSLDLTFILGEQDQIRQNLYAYIQGFSPTVRDIFERLNFHIQIERLAVGSLLHLVLEKFVNIDLSSKAVDDAQMGTVFEELIRKFSEISNETAGEHFTPRDVTRLMTSLLFVGDSVLKSGNSTVKTIYDPAAGSGGMLSTVAEYLSEHNPEAKLNIFAQELNEQSYAICKASMLISGKNSDNIIIGNSLSDDGYDGKKFDYMLSNLPFGVEWKKIDKVIRQEHEQKRFDGRFGPGLPRLSDSTLLFVLSLIHKMKSPSEGGSRICMIVTDSALRSGSVSSGESNIRKWIVENDLLECIVALPSGILFNTTIQSYILILSNQKHKSGIKLINGSGFWESMRMQIGCKSRYISENDVSGIVKLCEETGGEFVKNISKRELLYRSFRTEIGGNLISRNVSLDKNETAYLGLSESFGIDVRVEKNLEVGCEVDFFSFFSNSESKWASTLPLMALVEPCEFDSSWDLAIKSSGIIFRSSWNGHGDISRARFYNVRRNIISARFLEIYIEERSIKEIGTSRKVPTIAAHMNIRIECPSLRKQQAIVDFYTQKSEFLLRLSRVEQEQWGDSVEACIFKQRINEYADGIEYMAKIFPHPLASLLYKIQCERNKREILEGYRVFFECLGAVLSSIALGVVFENKTELDCFEILASRGKINRPTMGSYQNIIRKSREKSNDIAGFGGYVLSVVASKEVEEILIGCTDIRNEIAHRGLIKSSELGDYIDRCKKLLSRVSDVLSEFFTENFIAKQLNQKWNGIIFENEVISLTGIASFPFERKTKDSLCPLITGELYLFQSIDERNGAVNHIRLFHFMKCIEIIDGSDNEGFYFLNSIDQSESGGKTVFQFSAFQPLIEPRKVIVSEMLEGVYSIKKTKNSLT